MACLLIFCLRGLRGKKNRISWEKEVETAEEGLEEEGEEELATLTS